MPSPDADTSPGFFEALYRDHGDPWKFATSAAETARYQAMEDALGETRFARAFEPGCSVGVFTERLARHCDQVLACDVAPSAVAAAQARCQGLDHVTVTCGRLPDDVPDGPFDLMILAEIGYYFEASALGDLVTAMCTRLEPGGMLLGSHWLGDSADHRLGGDRVHAIIDTLAELRSVRTWCHQGEHRMSVWRKRERP